MFQIKYWVIAILLLSGCTSWRDVPVGHSRIPQVSGRDFSFTIGTSSTQTRKLFLAEDGDKGNDSVTSQAKDSQDAATNHNRLVSFHTYDVVAGLELFKRISLFWENGLYGLQFQTSGPTMLEDKGGQLSTSVVLGYNYITKSGRLLPMAKEDSQLNGSLSAHVGLVSFLAGIRPWSIMGVGLNLQVQPIFAKGSGFIDGAGTETDLKDSFYDYGAGAMVYFGRDSFVLNLSHTWVFIRDPISDDRYTSPRANLKLSYTF